MHNLFRSPALLNLVNAFEDAQKDGEGMMWCQRHGWDVDVFMDAETSLDYLLKVLDGLQFSLAEDEDKILSYGGVGSCVRRALCAAYYDHLARLRVAGSTKHGFVRVLDQARSNGTVDSMVDFATRTQPTTDANVAAPSDSDEPIVKAASRSALWHDNATSSDAAQLLVFGSMMLTDGSSNAVPTVQLLTYVSEDKVASGAADWCRLVDFKELLQTSARETVRWPVTRDVKKSILAARGEWLKTIQRKFPAIVASVEDEDLVISCPRRILPRVELHVRKLQRDVEPETVTLQLPDHVNMNKVIGKQGRNIKMLEDNTQTLLSSEASGAGRRHVRSARVLEIDGVTQEIRVKFQGASKALMPVIIGRIQSLIVETHSASMLPMVTHAPGERGHQMQQCPRLAQLLNSVAPASWATRDDVMLQVTHALVWRCDAAIYVGFLRDWVVRGESAIDIDVAMSPPQITIKSTHQMLQQYLAQSPGAQQRRVRILNRRTKGAARALAVGAHGLQSFDVDLVDPSNITTRMHPGVDCDAGNLTLTRTKSFCKKVDSTGDSLCSALEHVRNKQFVFYYALQSGVADDDGRTLHRLRKYLGRGWTCLSSVPNAVLQQLSDSERRLVQPHQ